MIPAPPPPTRRERQQQHGEGEPGLAALLDLRQRPLARLARLRRLGRPAGAFLGGGAVLVLAQPVGHADALGGDRLEGLARAAEEGGELAVGDGEGERRVAILVAGDQGVDPEHAAALVEQRPAAMAAGDVGGVEQGGDAVDRPDVGEDADRAGRRQRGDVVVDRARGGEIDIAGIAQRGDRRAVLQRADIKRDRNEAALPDLQQGEVAGRVDGEDAGVGCLGAFRRHHPHPDGLRIVGGHGDDMGVGDDPVGRDREAAAMTEAGDLAVLVEGDDDDAHHRAAGDRDVVGPRRRGERGQRQQEEKKSAHHRPGVVVALLWAGGGGGKRAMAGRRPDPAPR